VDLRGVRKDGKATLLGLAEPADDMHRPQNNHKKRRTKSDTEELEKKQTVGNGKTHDALLEEASLHGPKERGNGTVNATLLRNTPHPSAGNVGT